MLERLRTAFAQVKAGNTSGNLLMEIFQIMCMTIKCIWQYNCQKNVYDNILYLWNLETVKHLIHIDHLLNILLYWILEYTIHGKIWKNDTGTINVIYQVQCGTTNLN